MDRYFDRARGILNLMLFFSCFTVYSIYNLGQQSILSKLVDDALAILEPLEGGAEDLSDLKLSEFIDYISHVNDLNWEKEDEISMALTAAGLTQGRNPELGDWLDYEKENNREGIDISSLPEKFVHLFESNSRTLEIRKIEQKLRTHLSAMSATLGPLVTIGESAESLNPLLKIPVADMQLKAANVGTVLSLVCCFLLLYIYSLLVSIRIALQYQTEYFSLDLVLFHPGFLGLLLSALWIFLPMLASLYGVIHLNDHLTEQAHIAQIIITLILAALGGWLVFFLISCRSDAFEKLVQLNAKDE